MAKTAELAHNRIDNHEKFCRIMQKQTQDDIKSLRVDIARIEKIMLTS